jgi:hypothetical protein
LDLNATLFVAIIGNKRMNKKSYPNFNVLSGNRVALNAIKKRWIFWLFLSLCPTLAHAGDGDFSPFVFGFFGLVLGFVATLFLPYKWLGKSLALIPMMATFCFAGFFGGALLSEAATKKADISYRQAEAKTKSTLDDEFQASPLRKVACEGDDLALQQYLQTNKISATPQLIYRILQCESFTSTDLVRPLGFPLLVRELQASKRAANDNVAWDYFCQFISELHKKYAIPQLNALHGASVPISCGWQAGLGNLKERVWKGNPLVYQPQEMEKIWKWLLFLRQTGINLKPSRPDDTMLRLVVKCGEPRLIRFAVDVDTTYVQQGDVGYWVLRRFDPNTQCPLAISSLPAELEDIAYINRQLPTLTEATINGWWPGSLLWEVSRHSGYAENDGNGGAALFAYLIEHGAKLDREDNKGHNFMHDIYKIGPALRVELDKLTEEQVGLLLKSSKDPLLEFAKTNQRADILSFLCSRKIVGC